ncbi:hypothetical protein R6Q57_014703 [Mikania cordata]
MVFHLSIHGIPLDRWTKEGISRLMSAIGIPKMMDRVTRERCVHGRGKLGYARVMVEVSADASLPNVVEVEYPTTALALDNILGLEVTYQWKSLLCTHYRVFGHAESQCKKKPKVPQLETIVIPDCKEAVVGNQVKNLTVSPDEVANQAVSTSIFIPVAKGKPAKGKAQQGVASGMATSE